LRVIALLIIAGTKDNYFDDLITLRMKSHQEQISPLKNANSALSLNQTVNQSNLTLYILSKNLFRSTSKFNRIQYIEPVAFLLFHMQLCSLTFWMFWIKVDRLQFELM